MAKKLGGWQIGMLVYMRGMYGDQAGIVDERTLYKIRQIGPKQCTLDRVDKQTLQVTGYRGHQYRLFPREEAEQNMAGQRAGGYRGLYPYEWNQLLVAQGEAGWDPDVNF